MITIANPIYDAVFKFFMDDNHIAKRLISNIIGIEVVELSAMPQEISAKSEKNALSIFRLDYTALVQDQDGKRKRIIIEMQKSEHWIDIQRFRRYLGETYKKIDVRGEKDEEILPIICIYFLGFKINTLTHPYPVLKNGSHIIDVTNNAPIAEQSEAQASDFVRLLTHTSYFIQVPHLPLHSQNLLLNRLSVFSQFNLTTDYKWKKDFENWEQIEDSDLRDFIHRLWLAIQNEEVIEQAIAEEEIDAKLAELERRAEKAQEQADTERKEKEKAQKQANTERKEKEKERKEKEKERKEKERAQERADAERKEKERAQEQADAERKEKERAQQEKEYMLRLSVQALHSSGLSATAIAQLLNLSEVYVEYLLN